MSFDLSAKIALLGRTPALLDAWLRGLGHGWTELDEGPETFSPLEVLGHLVHGERTDWIDRARIILKEGEARPFDPYDRFAQRAMRETLDERLDLFARLRRENLEILASWELGPTDFEKRGVHPDFGPVTLGHLLSTWVVHDQVHLGQIARVLARGLGDEVGPWRTYLPILDR